MTKLFSSYVRAPQNAARGSEVIEPQQQERADGADDQVEDHQEIHRAERMAEHRVARERGGVAGRIQGTRVAVAEVGDSRKLMEVELRDLAAPQRAPVVDNAGQHESRLSSWRK